MLPGKKRAKFKLIPGSCGFPWQTGTTSSLLISHFPSSPFEKNISGIDIVFLMQPKLKTTCLLVTTQGVATQGPKKPQKGTLISNAITRHGKTRPVTGETRLLSMPNSPAPQDGPSPTHHSHTWVGMAFEFTSTVQVFKPLVFHSDHKPVDMCPKGPETPQV